MSDFSRDTGQDISNIDYLYNYFYENKNNITDENQIKLSELIFNYVEIYNKITNLGVNIEIIQQPSNLTNIYLYIKDLLPKINPEKDNEYKTNKYEIIKSRLETGFYRYSKYVLQEFEKKELTSSSK